MNGNTPQKHWVGESQALAEIKIVTEDCLPAQVIRARANLGSRLPIYTGQGLASDRNSSMASNP